MDDGSLDIRRIRWNECFHFPHLFRAFKISFHHNKILLALAGILATYAVGRALDGIWPAASSPIVIQSPGGAGGSTELDFFLSTDGDRAAIKAWQEEVSKLDSKMIARVGPFSLLFEKMRASVNLATAGVLTLNSGAVFEAIVGLAKTKMWLFRMHPVYAILFGIAWLAIWAFFGGAICRMIALHATRDERLDLKEALSFAKAKFLNFFLVQLFPAAVLALGVVALAFAGLLGSVMILDAIVGLFFFLALAAGFAMAFVIVGAAGGGCLMFPTIAVESSDTFDAFSRSLAYVFTRPWKWAFYVILSLIYGAICLAFAKLFVRIMMICVHGAVAFGMNWGWNTVTVKDPAGVTTQMPKLDAIWKAPTLAFDTPFYGSFAGPEVTGAFPSITHFFIKSWVYLVWGAVAAFAVCLFYSSSTLIYLLLRREVDATDIEDIFLEDFDLESPAPAEPTAPKPATSGGTSLPVIGQGP